MVLEPPSPEAQPGATPSRGSAHRQRAPSLCIHSAAVGEAASGTSQAFLAGKSKPSELLLKTLFNNER